MAVDKIRKIWIIIMAVFLFASSPIYAWEDCPLGVTDCPYPGECSRYIDTNNDGICDHSQSAPTTGTETTQDTSTENSGTVNEVDQSNETNSTALLEENNDKGAESKQSYYLLPITLILSLSYIVTHIMNKKRIIKLKSHKKLWNMIITVSFLVTGITGMELTLFINFRIHSPLNQTITFWHAVAAIFMVVTTFFHVHMYWKPFKNSFKLAKKSRKPKKEKLGSLNPVK